MTLQETLIGSLIILILTGLGFVSYRHPPIAIKIVLQVGGLLLFLAALFLSYGIGKIVVMNDIKDSAQSIIDSTYSTSAYSDSLEVINKEKRKVADNIKNNVIYISNETRKDFTNVLIFFICFTVTTFTVIWLSNMFNKVEKK